MRGGTSRTQNWWAADLFDSGSPLPPEEKSPARPQKPAGIFTRSLQGLRPYITPPTWSRCEESNGITFHPELITSAPYDQYLHLLHLLSKQKKKCGSATWSLSISSLGRPLYHASTADSCRTTWWLKTAAKATILARLALRHCFVSANGHELGCTSPGHSWFFFQRHSFLEKHLQSHLSAWYPCAAPPSQAILKNCTSSIASISILSTTQAASASRCLRRSRDLCPSRLWSPAPPTARNWGSGTQIHHFILGIRGIKWQIPNLVMTNSSPWYRWPIEIDGSPSYKMVIFHGYVSHNQRVPKKNMSENPPKYCVSIWRNSSLQWDVAEPCATTVIPLLSFWFCYGVCLKMAHPKKSWLIIVYPPKPLPCSWPILDTLLFNIPS